MTDEMQEFRRFTKDEIKDIGSDYMVKDLKLRVQDVFEGLFFAS